MSGGGSSGKYRTVTDDEGNEKQVRVMGFPPLRGSMAYNAALKKSGNNIGPTFYKNLSKIDPNQAKRRQAAARGTMVGGTASEGLWGTSRPAAWEMNPGLYNSIWS